MEAKNGFIKISPSSIGYLLECPRCLWLHFNEEVKRPSGLFSSLPDGMDNIFKEYFDSYRAKKKLPPEIAGKVNAKLFEDKEKLELWRNIDFGRGGLYASIPEHRITLRGAIDDLLVDEQGKYVPLDFKTRGYPTKDDTHQHYQHQLDLYALLFEKNDLQPADYGYLLFFWPEKYENFRTHFETDLIKVSISPIRALNLLITARAIIDGPKPESHADCEYCIYRGDESKPF